MSTRRDARAAHNALQQQYYADRSSAENVRVRPVPSTYVRRHIQNVIEYGGLMSGERILDVGCGMGKYTLPLAQRGFDVDGLDLSSELLAQLRDYGAMDGELYNHDVLARPPDLAGNYDVLLGFFMLHHLYDLRAAFEAFRFYLRPGGRIVFLDVNPACPLYYLQVTLTPGIKWAAEKGLLKLTRRNLMAHAERAGFGRIGLHRFGILPPFLMNTRFGPSLENAIDRSRIFRGVSAFQMLRATID